MFLITSYLFLFFCSQSLSSAIHYFLPKISNFQVATLETFNSKSKHISLLLRDICLTFSTRVRIYFGVIRNNIWIKSLHLLHIYGLLFGLFLFVFIILQSLPVFNKLLRMCECYIQQGTETNALRVLQEGLALEIIHDDPSFETV